MLRRSLTISLAFTVNEFDERVSYRQIIAKEEVASDGKDKDDKSYVIVICAKEPQFLPAFNKLSSDVKTLDNLRKAVLTYGYLELSQHFSTKSELDVSVNPEPKSDEGAKKFVICLDQHITLN